ncbi:oxygen sensor protein DosP [bacterium BMS3Abin12]|nr:oxygen sensor protein DosP [bacterium BMS3Abin12]
MAESVGEALRRTGADPHCLVVEVTEAILTEPVDPNLAHNLRTLRELGVQLNLDHYGTGAVSPPQLHRYAPQSLKIDRPFIGPLLRDRDCVRVTTAIIAMARTLGIRVIAEGVETAEQLALLQEQRCDGAQGHYLSKALSWDECLEWIDGRRETATASRAG